MIDAGVAQKLPSLTQIQGELLRRDFRRYIREAWPHVEPKAFTPGWHIDAIADHLVWVTHGEIDQLMINIPPRFSKPVSVDSRVLMGDGSRKRLGDVVVGDEVIGKSGRRALVTATHEQGELECLRVETHNGRTLELAPDHPVLTPEGWVEAGKLSVGQCVVQRRWVDCAVETRRADAEFALAGYFVGDGSTKGNSANITSCDPEYIDDVLSLCSQLGFTATVATYDNPKVKRINVKDGVRGWLREIGLAGKGSADKTVPEFVFRGDNKQIAQFIAAYFHCDGTVTKKAPNRRQVVISFSSISRELLEGVQHLLLRLGVSARLRKRVVKTDGQFVKAGYVHYALEISKEHEARKFLDVIPVLSRKKDRIVERGLFKKQVDSEYETDEIVSIQPIGKLVCRCLTVADEHSFIAEDIIVHNSTSVCVMWPTWVWTIPEFSGIQWLCTAYSSILSVRDTLKSRRLILSPWYQERFGDTFHLSYDENLKHRYSNNKGGYRVATSVDGTGTGEGGDIQLIDDLHNMKEIYSDTQREKGVDYYKNVFRSRLNNPDRPRRVCVMQRGHDADVAGHIHETERSDWTWLVLPQEYDPARRTVTVIKNEIRFEDPRTAKGDLLCPARMGEKAVQREKRAMTNRDYQAQHNQDPSAGGGLILKKGDWKRWPHHEPPAVFALISFWDTAFEKKEEADYSARTTWGFFLHSESGDPKDQEPHAILLSGWYERCSYPELKQEIKKTHARFEEDFIVIEKKASGQDLLNDLRADDRKYPVRGFTPKADKVMRAHIASYPLERGYVWYLDREWAEDIINICAKFPATDKKDVVDTVTMGLIYFKKKYMVAEEDLTDDRDEFTDVARRKRKSIY